MAQQQFRVEAGLGLGDAGGSEPAGGRGGQVAEAHGRRYLVEAGSGAPPSRVTCLSRSAWKCDDTASSSSARSPLSTLVSWWVVKLTR